MNFDLVNLLVVGLIAGFLVGAVLPGHGFGKLGNFVLGLLGAIVGSVVYTMVLKKAGLTLNLRSISIDLNEVVVAVGGALLVALLFRLFVRGKQSH